MLPPGDVPRSVAALSGDALPDDADVPFEPDINTASVAAEQQWLTPDPFARTDGAVDADEDADYLLEQHFWATAVVGRDRLIELSTHAASLSVEGPPVNRVRLSWPSASA